MQWSYQNNRIHIYNDQSVQLEWNTLVNLGIHLECLYQLYLLCGCFSHMSIHKLVISYCWSVSLVYVCVCVTMTKGHCERWVVNRQSPFGRPHQKMLFVSTTTIIVCHLFSFLIALLFYFDFFQWLDFQVWFDQCDDDDDHMHDNVANWTKASSDSLWTFG